MNTLLLVLALTAPAGSDADATVQSDGPACSVTAHAVDREGRTRSARRVSASVVPGIVFRGRVAARDENEKPLLFDVYNPRGHRYQVLLAAPRVVTKERDGHRFERTSRTREAALAVAGSSIAWTSMYGKWRVVPRIEGESRPCGRAEYFTIRP